MARDFNGTDEWLEVSSNSSWQVSPITYGCWLIADTDNVANPRIMDAGNANFNRDFYLGLLSANSNIFYAVDATAFKDSGEVMNGVAGTTFQNLAVTYDETTARLYENGTQVDTDLGSGAITYTPNSLFIAVVNPTSEANARFNGKIGEVFIISGTLTPTQLAAWSRGANIFSFGMNLVLYCPIWGNESPEPDWSGNGNTAALTNTPLKWTKHPPVELIENFL